MEINCGEENRNCGNWWSGLTSHNTVMTNTNDMQSGPESAIYFYGKQGLIKKLTFQNDYPQEGKILKAAETFTQVAENGDYAAALRHEVTYEKDGENSYKNKKHKYTLYFYDDSGNLLWQKDLGWGKLIKMTRDGKYVVVDSVNWNLMDNEGGDSPRFDTMDKIDTSNVKQFKIFNYKGEEVFEYKGFTEFKHFAGYGFSGNSRYFYAEIDRLYYSGNRTREESFLLYDIEARKMVFEVPREKLLGKDNWNIYKLTYNGDGIVTSYSRVLDLKGNKVIDLWATKGAGPLRFFGGGEKYLLITRKYNTHEYDYLYDFADYIALTKRGEQPKALKKYGLFFMGDSKVGISLTETKGFTEFLNDTRDLNGAEIVFATVWDDVLWKTPSGIRFENNPEYTYFAIDKEIAGQNHRYYYRIPQ